MALLTLLAPLFVTQLALGTPVFPLQVPLLPAHMLRLAVPLGTPDPAAVVVAVAVVDRILAGPVVPDPLQAVAARPGGSSRYLVATQGPRGVAALSQRPSRYRK